MRRYLKRVLFAAFLVLVVYGSVRIYFKLTDGFKIANISSSLEVNPDRDVRPLQEEEKTLVDSILSQEFTYLGKGCQSYVFLSSDQKYVLKFFKYQRHRPSPLLRFFGFLPVVSQWKEEKILQKRVNLDKLFQSWKLAFEEFPEESGVVYVHLNKSEFLKKQLRISDKLGRKHLLDMDQMEFMLQKRASVLQGHLSSLMEDKKTEDAKRLLSKLVTLIVSEYRKGLFDRDDAVLQNTGVVDGTPIHIDVGAFEIRASVKDPKEANQELFNQTYRLHTWLEENHPELACHLDQKLYQAIGEPYYALEPDLKKSILR